MSVLLLSGDNETSDDDDLPARDVADDPRPPSPVDWDEEEADDVRSTYHGLPLAPEVKARMKELYAAHAREDDVRTHGRRAE